MKMEDGCDNGVGRCQPNGRKKISFSISFWIRIINVSNKSYLQRDRNSNFNFKGFRKKIAVACANAVSRREYQRNAFTNIPRSRMKLE